MNSIVGLARVTDFLHQPFSRWSVLMIQTKCACRCSGRARESKNGRLTIKYSVDFARWLFFFSQQPLFSPRRHRDERTLHTFTKSKNQDLWHFSRLSMCRNITKLWLKKEAKTGWKRTRNRQLMEVSKISHDIYDWLDKEDSGLIWTRTDDKRRQQRQHVDFSRWSTELEHWKLWPF